MGGSTMNQKNKTEQDKAVVSSLPHNSFINTSSFCINKVQFTIYRS